MRQTTRRKEKKKDQVNQKKQRIESLNGFDALDLDDSLDYLEYSDCTYFERSEWIFICMNWKEWYDEYEVLFKT